MYSLYFPIPSCLIISLRVPTNQALYAFTSIPKFWRVLDSISSLRAHAPTFVDGFTSVQMWYHSSNLSCVSSLANSDSCPSSSIWKYYVRLFQIFAPDIVGLNFVLLLAASNSASSVGFMSNILKYFGVVAPYFDSDQTLSAWALTYSFVKKIFSNRFNIPSLFGSVGSPASYLVGTLNVPIIW